MEQRVCDRCLEVLSEHGLVSDRPIETVLEQRGISEEDARYSGEYERIKSLRLHAQEEVMMELGADLEDHPCDEVETNGATKCACGCRRL